MQALEKTLRKKLKRTVIEARDIAEAHQFASIDN